MGIDYAIALEDENVSLYEVESETEHDLMTYPVAIPFIHTAFPETPECVDLMNELRNEEPKTIHINIDERSCNVKYR